MKMVVILWKVSTEALITRFLDAGYQSTERRCRPLLYRLNRRIYHLYHVRATRRKRIICNCSSCLATISSVAMPASRYQWGRNWRQILSHARLKRPFFTKKKLIVLLVNSITFFALFHEFAQHFLWPFCSISLYDFAQVSYGPDDVMPTFCVCLCGDREEVYVY